LTNKSNPRADPNMSAEEGSGTVVPPPLPWNRRLSSVKLSPFPLKAAPFNVSEVMEAPLDVTPKKPLN
jgi:hypothetical protein